MPKYWVFTNGLLTQPNTLATQTARHRGAAQLRRPLLPPQMGGPVNRYTFQPILYRALVGLMVALRALYGQGAAHELVRDSMGDADLYRSTK